MVAKFGVPQIPILFRLQYCKIIQKVKKSTPSCMVLGELGRYPMQYYIDYKMSCFWFRLISNNRNKFSNIFYKLLYKLHSLELFNDKWISHINEILFKCELLSLWENQNHLTMNIIVFKQVCKEKLKKYYENIWLSEVTNSRKFFFYRKFKSISLVLMYP